MMVPPRKGLGFFSGDNDEYHHELPLTTTSHTNAPLNAMYGSSINQRLGRSLSSSAAILKQRHHSYSPPSVLKTQPDVLEGFLRTPYGFQPAPPPSRRQWILQAVSIVSLGLLCWIGLALHDHNRKLQQILVVRENEIELHMDHTDHLELKVSKLKSLNLKLNRQIEALEQQPAVGTTELQRKLFHMEHYQSLIQQGIQTSARRIVREKFGPGPYYFVELQLDLPAPNTILLETAHLDAVPHSIQLFLEQVSHGLYDSTAFHLNAPHKLQAGPSSNPKAHEVFRQHPSLNSLLFQEYNPTFPHAQYTLGYAGRPGGPDFYINMKDNTNLQASSNYYSYFDHDSNHTPDPCFARVVAGVNILQYVRQQPVGWDDVLLPPVPIQRMRVLSEEEYERLLATTKDRVSEY